MLAGWHSLRDFENARLITAWLISAAHRLSSVFSYSNCRGGLRLASPALSIWQRGRATSLGLSPSMDLSAILAPDVPSGHLYRYWMIVRRILSALPLAVTLAVLTRAPMNAVRCSSCLIDYQASLLYFAFVEGEALRRVTPDASGFSDGPAW